MTSITSGTIETIATSRQGSLEGRHEIETSGVTRTGLQRQDPIRIIYHCSYTVYIKTFEGENFRSFRRFFLNANVLTLKIFPLND